MHTLPLRRDLWRRSLALLGSATLVVAACSDNDGTGAGGDGDGDATVTTAVTAEPIRGGTLRYAVEGDTAGPWLPSTMLCAASCHSTVGRTVFEPLVVLADDGELLPVPARGDHAERRLHSVDTGCPPGHHLPRRNRFRWRRYRRTHRDSPHRPPLLAAAVLPPSSGIASDGEHDRDGDDESAVAGVPDLPEQPARLRPVADVDRRRSRGHSEPHRAGGYRALSVRVLRVGESGRFRGYPLRQLLAGGRSELRDCTRGSRTSTPSRSGSSPTARPAARHCLPATSTSFRPPTPSKSATSRPTSTSPSRCSIARTRPKPSTCLSTTWPGSAAIPIRSPTSGCGAGWPTPRATSH